MHCNTPCYYNVYHLQHTLYIQYVHVHIHVQIYTDSDDKQSVNYAYLKKSFIFTIRGVVLQVSFHINNRHECHVGFLNELQCEDGRGERRREGAWREGGREGEREHGGRRGGGTDRREGKHVVKDTLIKKKPIIQHLDQTE